jgi:hypothetical protein
MNEALQAEYLNIRRKHPWLPSKQAILWAKGNLKPLALEWITFPNGHFAEAKAFESPEGYDIRVVVDYDEYASVDITFTDDPSSGIRNPRYVYPDRGWGGRETGSDKRYVQLESDYTVAQLAKDYHERGESKGVAWEHARESLEDEAKGYLGEDYVQLIVTAIASIDGVEIGRGGIGTDLIIDYGTLERELDNAVEETGVIFEAVENAKENVTAIVERERTRLARMEALTT